MNPGRIIHLNGNSSAGKSTIAKALQDVLEEPYLHTGIDHFLERYPGRLIEYSDGSSPARAAGWLIVFRNDVVVEVRIGPLGYQFLAGMYRAIAALAGAGINVIVDDVIYDEQVLRSAVEAFRASDVFMVGIRCPVEVAERREHERGNRVQGGARTFGPLVHRYAIYDLEVDSAALSAAECAEKIKQALRVGTKPDALASLAVRLAEPGKS